MSHLLRSRSALVLVGLLASACGREPTPYSSSEFKKVAAAMTVSTTPKVKTGVSLIATSEGLVLFGGCTTADAASCDASNLRGDTWKFDGSTWTRFEPVHTPPARTGAALVEDTTRHVLVLFGGAGFENDGTTPKFFDDTWEWNGSDWTAMAGAAPAPRASAIAVFDPRVPAVVVHGGVGQGANGPFAFDDLWSWDGAAWSTIATATGTGSRRSDGALGLGSQDGHYVRWGDSTAPGDLQPAFSEWDGTNWVGLADTNRPSPFPVAGAAAWIPGQGFIFSGGIVPGVGRVPFLAGAMGDPPTWMPVPAGQPRSNHAVAFDTTTPRFYMFGGVTDAGANADLWSFEPDGWHLRYAACASTSDCAAYGDYACSSNKCVPVVAAGSACSLDVECGSGHCADGVCCDMACQGRCEACNIPGSVGQCAAVTGTPVGDRAACETDGSSCGGSCDGVVRDACTYPTTSCRAASCASGVSHDETTCDGAGHCPAASATSCGTYACSGTTCLGDCETDDECSSGAVCVDGACTSKASMLACDDDHQCGSGHCVDGVCCNTACDGQCEACNVEGKVGTCAPVLGAPSGSRPACGSDGTSCGGSCDGVTRTACSYPTTSCRVPSCSGDEFEKGASCDGAGHCPDFQKSSCNGYVCRDAACVTKCTSLSDCAPGYGCDQGTCKAVDPSDGDDALGTYDENATTTDGAGTTAPSTDGADAEPLASGGGCSASPSTQATRATGFVGLLFGLGLVVCRRRRSH